MFAKQTKEEAIGRFVVELNRKSDDDYTAYEIFHFCDYSFRQKKIAWKKHFAKTNPITSVGHDYQI